MVDIFELSLQRLFEPLSPYWLEADVRKADFKPSSQGDLLGEQGPGGHKLISLSPLAGASMEDSCRSMHREITGMV
jgi:hypothetical protein